MTKLRSHACNLSVLFAQQCAGVTNEPFTLCIAPNTVAHKYATHIAVKYYNTQIITLSHESIILHAHGCYTQTTRSRLNAVLPTWIRVGMRYGHWIVVADNREYIYYDGITFDAKTHAEILSNGASRAEAQARAKYDYLQVLHEKIAHYCAAITNKALYAAMRNVHDVCAVCNQLEVYADYESAHDQDVHDHYLLHLEQPLSLSILRHVYHAYHGEQWLHVLLQHVTDREQREQIKHTVLRFFRHHLLHM